MNGVGLAGHEVAEVVDDLAVLLGADPADAGRRALADVAEQAGPADLRGALEDAVAARAHREDPQQQVDGLADRPGVASRGRSSGRPCCLAPRPTITRGNSSPRVTASHG